MVKNGLIFSFLLFCVSATAQKSKVLQIGKQTPDFYIKENESKEFIFLLKKDSYYTLVTEQKGIDLVITLKDKSGKQLQNMDSPNGKFGPEKIDFSPDSTAVFLLTVKSLTDSANAKEGKFSVIINEAPLKLKSYSSTALSQDFDILKNAFIETHVGLWYNTYAQFDSICRVQKSKIKDKMNALEFYQIVAPIVAFTKEGHSNVKTSDEINTYIKQHYRYFPFFVKILNGKVYITNNLENFNTRGLQISKINGISIDTIMRTFLSIQYADGYNMTSKYRWIENSFSRHYSRFFKQTSIFDLELVNPKNNELIIYKNIPAYNFKEFIKLYDNFIETNPNDAFEEAATFKIDSGLHTAILTVNTFDPTNYEEGRKGFQLFIENAFKTISDNKLSNIIIDVRENGGGQEGMYDYILSYLTDKEYQKYKYVEIPAFTYSLYKYTQYKDNPLDLEKALKEDFCRTADGRYLDTGKRYKGEHPKENNFKGTIYILVSGATFSGGSEFAALAKNYTTAKFIGEEVGGGYYGNTSGKFLQFTLPNSKLTGRIPLLKFVVESKENTIPFGHGVLPDYHIQPTIDEYLSGYDAELEYAKKIIGKKQ